MANELNDLLGIDADDNEEEAGLFSVAVSAQPIQVTKKKGDPGEFFTFILDEAKTNDNGVNLPKSELDAAAKTAIGRKIKLATKPIEKEGDLHERSFTSKVGKIVAARVEGDQIICEGHISANTEHQRLCRESLIDGDIGFVSKENRFKFGTCGKCGQEFKTLDDPCKHLKVDRNLKMVFGRPGAPVIMHGVYYTAVALLDKPGALNTGRILEVAATNFKSEEIMADKDGKSELEAQAGKFAEMETKLAALEKSVADLTTERDDLKTRVDAFEKTEKERAVASLVDLMEKKGRVFKDAAAKDAEAKKLMALSADAFAAKRESYDEMPEPKAEAPAEPPKTKTAPEPKTQATKADAKPTDVSDRGDGGDDIKTLAKAAVAR